MRKEFVSTLISEAIKDSKIILITGDLGYGVLDEFQQKLPNQFINVGITEQSMIGIAAGMAATGFKPFVYSIANFPTFRCLEQIRNDVCYMNQNVSIISVGAGYSYGAQGYTHHAIEDIAAMRILPKMKIYSPFSANDTIACTKEIVRQSGPSYLRLGKDSNEKLVDDCTTVRSVSEFFEFKKGTSATLLFTGNLVNLVMEAATLLKKENIEVSVLACSDLDNLDSSSLEDIAKDGPIITIEEHSVKGGFGSTIAEWYLKNMNQTPLMSIVGSHQNNLQLIGDQNFLLEKNGISVSKIVSVTKSLLGRK